MTSAIRCVHSAGAVLGEGPVWVDRERALFWTDIHGRRVHRYVPERDESRSWDTPLRITSLGPRAGGGFVAGSERGFVLIDEAISRFDIVAEPEPDRPGNRFNDGKVGPDGRFWAGTMDDAEVETTGALYRLDTDLIWKRCDVGYRVPNGPTFSPDGQVLYHTDSATRTVFRFDLDPKNGEVRNKRIFVQFGPEHGHPDGMTSDSDGCLWIAFWDGWCVRRISPDGRIVGEVRLPVQRPTSCAFGGDDLGVLFVTSASVGIDASGRDAQPLAGGLFALEPGASGWPAPEFPA